ncbi:pentapeptide repeat-containing protein [Candidatus Sumerlaeota bacterium]|nr:pentapeptide repeat-containing protein [Candidatus Sumerlaeota bacterium]
MLHRITNKKTGEILFSVKTNPDERTGFNLVEMRNMNLQEADLRHALMLQADLNGADLGFSDLRAAQLAGADLRKTNLHGARMKGVYLLDAIYDRDTVWPEGFNPSHNGAVFVPSY